MRFILASVGTDGDIFPYVGAGAALRSRGHQVTLLACAHYETLARAHGFAFKPLVSAQENDELFNHPDFWNPRKNALLMARWGGRFISRQYELFTHLITEDTVLAASPGVLATGLIHEKFGIPWVNFILQPWMISSSISPPIMPGFGFLRRAPRPVWKVFWRALDVVVDNLIGRSLNRARASLGLKPRRRILSHWLSPQLVLGLFPEWYGPPQADWPSQIRLIGFPMYDGGQGESLTPELLAFCRARTPPIAFTFGSGMAHPSELFRASLQACAVLGQRGIFLTKFEDKLPSPLPPHIFHTVSAPFTKLFPECAAVVHHGGIGTMAEAMAAGIPQLVCPFCFDQFDNGARAKRLGVGDWLKTRPFNGKKIAAALTRLITDETRSRCRAISGRFQHHNALEAAAQCLQEFGIAQ
jgi:UDP:flavonoid glycosyltransferase YjiC (YdhE family)